MQAQPWPPLGETEGNRLLCWISLLPSLGVAERVPGTFWKVSWGGWGMGPLLTEALEGSHKTSLSSGFYYTCRM